jgi:HEAT repeat protein
MDELRSIAGNSTFARQLLIEQLMKVKKNLTGRSAKALVTTYYALDLDKLSVAKLKRFAWKMKALGIRELGEMEHRESIPVISRFLSSKNPILREESIMALVRIDHENPLSFLDHYQQEISLWMRINIYHFLVKLDQKKLPLFSRWFQHPNESVVLFTISMTRQFRQIASTKDLIPLLHGHNNKVKALVLETLAELDAYEYVHEVEQLAQTSWDNAKLSNRIIQCLVRIGDPVSANKIITKFLQHPVYHVRFEAVKALIKNGDAGRKELNHFEEQTGSLLAGITRHLEEPLLQ